MAAALGWPFRPERPATTLSDGPPSGAVRTANPGPAALLATSTWLILVGAAWLAPVLLARLITWVFVPITDAAEWATVVCVLVFLPAAFLRATRSFAQWGLRLSAWLFAATLWLTAWGVTYSAWGRVPAILGVSLGGFPILPLGLVAALVKAEWTAALSLIVLFAAWMGAGWGAAKIARGSSSPSATPPPSWSAGWTATAAAYEFGVLVASPFFAAWLTHIVAGLQTKDWSTLVFGAVIFPVGIIHGFGLWFGWFR